MSVIATALKHLLAAGMSGDALVAAVAEIEAAQAAAGPTVDAQAVVRRERDAERKRVARAGERERLRTSADSADGADIEDDTRPLPPPSPKPPQTPQEPQPPLTPTRDTTRTREADPIGSIQLAWNTMARRTGLKAIGKMTAERRQRARARIAEHGPSAFTEAIAAVERSPFCRGDNDRGWRADFDFLLQPTSFNRLIEGSYDRAANDRPRSSGSGKPSPWTPRADLAGQEPFTLDA